ncbi:MAG: hypothetical protein SFX74_03900 [Fimbriimonadaceae bacterium]|nr:hypothetical protein [Fimbriimonadaceae bacterium]
MPETVTFGRWPEMIRIADDRAELHVSTQFGPRILGANLLEAPNLMYQFPPETEPDGYRFYGGHRLWIAPESRELSMQPENEPVAVRHGEQSVQLTAPTDTNGFTKSLVIAARGDGQFVVTHGLTYSGEAPRTVAPWALSMLVAGTRVVFPQPEYVSHESDVLPNRPLVTWGYTDLSDPRWTWHPALASLQQSPTRTPQKIGTYLAEGWAAAIGHGQLLLKTFGALAGSGAGVQDPTQIYPDMGCNFETFTNGDMIEIESLGPKATVTAGSALIHEERWLIASAKDLPSAPVQLREALAALADRLRD